MFSFVRTGPKLIVFGSDNVCELSNFFKDNLKGISVGLIQALEIAQEDNTIIFITEPGKKIARLEDVKSIILVPERSDYLFSSILNLNAYSYIKDSHIAPGTVIMRVLGNTEKIIESIRQTYDGKIMSIEKCLDIGISNQTILSFTEKPINKNLNLKDFKDEHMLIDMPPHILHKRLMSQSLRFLNEGLEDKNWYDLQIRIYDRYSKYRLHYERLSIVLDNLESGLVLGESYAKDYPRFLMSVLVYQIRLFTLLNPIEIKKMLLSMEYLEDGTRISDLDLIYKGKKVDWVEALEPSTKGFTRQELGMKFREETFKKLTADNIEKIKKYDEEIIATRK
ncbi:hypothetical protein SAMN05443428_1222 [Caloramator quimbayensis]|uniref:Uncharacterized protein n=1 Tax=Caloramator quimbayensis TaxID=1147123 RepID=A0A1T4Y4B5_9CLOT|nr:hypothetical protein [Caloramator quimbayensis]SKA96629.1 hypothetical protein SAMN05443428_1222 [Caloramator quimbayensis]